MSSEKPGGGAWERLASQGTQVFGAGSDPAPADNGGTGAGGAAATLDDDARASHAYDAEIAYNATHRKLFLIRLYLALVILTGAPTILVCRSNVIPWGYIWRLLALWLLVPIAALAVRHVRERRSKKQKDESPAGDGNATLVVCLLIAVAILVAGVPAVLDLPYISHPEQVTIANASSRNFIRDTYIRQRGRGASYKKPLYYLRHDGGQYEISESAYDSCLAVLRSADGRPVDATISILPHSNTVFNPECHIVK